MSVKCAPVAMFVYNRPDHTRRTLDSLRKDDLASQSDLFVYADGPKTQGAPGVAEVREVIRNITGFKSVTVVERERNVGLTDSIIDGVTKMCNQFGSVIAVEDDVLFTTDFLTFMNSALERYAGERRVYSICGFHFPIAIPASYPYDAYCSCRSMAWGAWATWKDRWDTVDWAVSDFPEFIADREQRKRFDRGGNDLTWMLSLQRVGKIEGSWDVTWGYTHFKNNAVALLPTISKVYNIGFDGSGVHCNWEPFKQTPLVPPATTDYRFPESLELDPYFVSGIQRLVRRPLVRRVGRFVYEKLGLR